MLTKSQIIRSYKLHQFLGSSDGSCFGVTDPSRLRRHPNMIPFSLPKYRLEFSDKKRKPIAFDAVNRKKAFELMRAYLGLRDTGNLTVERFRKAGGSKFFFEGKQLFPHTTKRQS